MTRTALNLFITGLYVILFCHLQISGAVLQKCPKRQSDGRSFVMGEGQDNVSISGPFSLSWKYYRKESATNAINWYFLGDQIKELLFNDDVELDDAYNTGLNLCSHCRIEYKESMKVSFFQSFTILVEEIGGENGSERLSFSKMDFTYKASWDILQTNCVNFTCSHIDVSTTFILWSFYTHRTLEEEVFNLTACELNSARKHLNVSSIYMYSNKSQYIKHFECNSNGSAWIVLKENEAYDEEKLYIRCSDAFFRHRGSRLLPVHEGGGTSCGDTPQQIDENCDRANEPYSVNEHPTGNNEKISTFLRRNLMPTVLSTGIFFLLIVSSVLICKLCRKKRTGVQVNEETCNGDQNPRDSSLHSERESILKLKTTGDDAYSLCALHTEFKTDTEHVQIKRRSNESARDEHRRDNAYSFCAMPNVVVDEAQRE